MRWNINTGTIFSDLKILFHQGKQYIPDVTTVAVPGKFKGRPIISDVHSGNNLEEVIGVCPTGAILASPLRIDMGKCAFCGECQLKYPALFRFTKDYKLA
ncbi:NADH:ubiquinone oxidoreductase, partial [bacterium]